MCCSDEDETTSRAEIPPSPQFAVSTVQFCNGVVLVLVLLVLVEEVVDVDDVEEVIDEVVLSLPVKFVLVVVSIGDPEDDDEDGVDVVLVEEVSDVVDETTVAVGDVDEPVPLVMDVVDDDDDALVLMSVVEVLLVGELVVDEEAVL